MRLSEARCGAVAALSLLAIAAGCSSPADHAPSACSGANLSVSRIGSDAGMGHRAVTYAFRNTSKNTCVIGGYAGVTALDGQQRIVHDVSVTHRTSDDLTAAHKVAKIDLAPGDVAWFSIGYSVIPHGNAACPKVASLRIAAPGEQAGAPFEQAMQPCDGIEVLPLQPGPPVY